MNLNMGIKFLWNRADLVFRFCILIFFLGYLYNIHIFVENMYPISINHDFDLLNGLYQVLLRQMQSYWIKALMGYLFST